MTDHFGRELNDARRAQGFHSQAHLDAFYSYYDHTCVCSECQKPGTPAALDDGYQPTQNRCATARDLEAKLWKIQDERAA